MSAAIDSDGSPRIAAVSGGSSGIGRAIAEALGTLGWKVAIGARRVERVREAEEAVRKAGGEALGAALDVSDAASIDAFYAAAEQTLGPVDAVVNCAAHGRPGPLHELPAEEIRSEIEAGLIGALLFSRRGIRAMLERGLQGDVLFVSSTSAAVPWPFHSPYAASKAGLEHAARSLSLELEGKGIRSTVVRVGNTVGTGWSASWKPEEFAFTSVWARLGLIRHAGLMQPADVARAVVAVLTTPRGVQLECVSVHPEAPRGTPQPPDPSQFQP